MKNNNFSETASNTGDASSSASKELEKQITKFHRLLLSGQRESNIAKLVQNSETNGKRAKIQIIDKIPLGDREVEVKLSLLEPKFDQLDDTEKTIVGHLESLSFPEILTKDGQELTYDQKQSIVEKLRKLEEPAKMIMENANELSESIESCKNTSKKKEIEKNIERIRSFCEERAKDYKDGFIWKRVYVQTLKTRVERLDSLRGDEEQLKRQYSDLPESDLQKRKEDVSTLKEDLKVFNAGLFKYKLSIYRSSPNKPDEQIDLLKQMQDFKKVIDLHIKTIDKILKMRKAQETIQDSSIPPSA